VSDPIDLAAIRILPDQLGYAAGVDSHVVPVSVAKRIRDEAVAKVNAELDGLYQALTDAARAVAKYTPPGDEKLSLAGAIKTVYEYGFLQGVANAMATISDALEEPVGPGQRGPYFFTEAEWDRLSGLFLANSDIGLGSELDQAIFSKLVDAADLDPVEHIGPCEEAS
jgi:hypothetical protein